MEEKCCNKIESLCNFDYIKPSDCGIKRIETVRAAFKALEIELRAVLPANRETSLVWTNLEQACMWATKGICLVDEQLTKSNGCTENNCAA